MALTVTEVVARDIRFPTSRELDGSDAMNLGPTTRPPTSILKTDGRARRARPDVHDRPRQRAVRGRDPALAQPRRRGRTLESITGDMRRVLAQPDPGQPAPLAGAGEGRDPPGHRRGRQRGVGPVGEARGQAAVEAAGGHDARRSWSRCIDFRYITDALTPERGGRRCCDGRRPARAAREAEMRARRLPGLHDLGRLARLLRREGPAARARGDGRRAGRTSRSRSGRTSRTTCAAPRSCARRSAPAAS